MNAIALQIESLRSELADRYTFERELGQGGMAAVFLARDLKHERAVALKVLSPELTTAVGTERFVREIQITARLQHPHILTLIDSGQAGGLVYYVMPYVEGESLRERMMWTRQLPVEDALRIVSEVAEALAYAHAQGIVHRDIKPENILLSADHAVLADFGIARAMGGRPLTVAGLAIGTPAYMSPEQAAGSAEVDGRSDIYALGCVLYEMLAGRPPFIGETVESVVKQHLTAEPPPLAQLRPEVTPELSRLVGRCLAKKPAARPASARDCLAELSGLGRKRRRTAPAIRAARSRIQANPRRWWQLDLIACIGFLPVVLYLAWLVRGWRPGAWARGAFFGVLVSQVVSNVYRLYFAFMILFRLRGLSAEVRRAAPLMRASDAVLMALLLGLGASVAEDHSAVAALLLGLGTAGVLRVLVFEPTMIREAFPTGATAPDPKPGK